MKGKKSVKNKNTIVKEDLGSGELVKILEEEIINLRNRIKTGRIRDVGIEEIRIKNLRTLGYLCKIHRELQESQKIELIKREIDEIRQTVAENGDKHVQI
jgi:hypothetical protein